MNNPDPSPPKLADLAARVDRLEERVNRQIRDLYDEIHSHSTKPDEALRKARMVAEAVCKQVLLLRGEGPLPPSITLNTLIQKLRQEGGEAPVDRQVILSLESIRDRANPWSHHTTEAVPASVLRGTLADLTHVVDWYFHDVLLQKRTLATRVAGVARRLLPRLTLLGTSLIVAAALLFASVVLIVGWNMYRVFARGPDVEDSPQVQALTNVFDAFTPKPLLVKADTRPQGAWVFVYPKDFKAMMKLERPDEDDEDNAMNLVGRTPFGKVSRGMSFVRAMGAQQGIEAFFYLPGYAPKTVAIDRVFGEVDLGVVDLEALDPRRPTRPALTEFLQEPASFTGRLLEFQGTIAPTDDRRVRREYESNAAKCLDALPAPADVAWLAFSQPPFTEAVMLFAPKSALTQMLPAALRGPVEGRFVLLMPVGPFNGIGAQRVIAQLRSIHASGSGGGAVVLVP